jgi:peptidylprolyl isomerase
MTKNTLRLALVAASGAALAGCLDTTAPDPRYDCLVTSPPSVAIAGDTVREANGLKYINRQPGDTTASGTNVLAGSTVEVCYVAFFPNGQVFDPGSRPLEFVPSANQVIPGFARGVIGMREGSTRRIIVPPALGYGATPVQRNGVVVIPANSTLVFDVGVLRVR